MPPAPPAEPAATDAPGAKRPVPPPVKDYDAPRAEAEVQARWVQERTHERAREARAGGEPYYFIDGPPYTSGHIHLGTAWNKVIKDAVVRWRRASGYQVRDQAGYDMHGLPIEVKVEQELGIRNKQEIEALGVGRFVGKCREFSTRFLDVMTGEFRQLGVWLDWDYPYMTIRNAYIEGAWGAFAVAHRKGLVYRAQRSIAWCWRCQTALAAAEMEYQDREDPSIYVKFPLLEPGHEGEALLIWTTTPWTLPGNVAIAAHPDLTYAKVEATRRGQREVLWVVDAQVAHVMALAKADAHRVLETRSGRDLEGWAYAHVFAEEVPFHRDPGGSGGPRNRVVLGEHVTADKTGLVHTATGFGAEDFEVGQRYGIAAFCPVDDAGVYTAEAGAFAGRFVRDAEPDIIQRLEGRGALLHAGRERHSYGHCWRCKQPIIYRATEQWFLEVTKQKEKMLAEVERVRWVPEWAGSARQKDWVAQARDWCVSRQRYWGIPIPIWTCGASHTTVVGSVAELTERAANYDDVLSRYRAQLHVPELEARLRSMPTDEVDLHRPWVDEVVLRCAAQGCGQEMRRVPDVFDVWYDSACASWAALGWPRDPAGFGKWWPGRWIVEGLDQTRGWFYSQLAAGVAAFDRVPYEAVLMHGFVHDDQGRPMSKSLGNIIPPQEVIAKHGADAFRLYMLSTCAPWEDVRFNWEGVRNAQRALTILWNVHVIAAQALQGRAWPDALPPEVEAALQPEDRWMRSRTAALAEEVTRAFEADELHRAARALQAFTTDDLSRWYVRLVRDRLQADDDSPEALAARHTLHEALLVLCRLLAPVCPHLVERIHEGQGGARDSVHLEPWPSAAHLPPRDEGLEAHMSLARGIVEAALAARDAAQAKLRMPLAELTVTGGEGAELAVRALGPLIAEAVNVKRVAFTGAQFGALVWQAEPDRAKVGPAFKALAGQVTQAVKAADAAALREALTQGPTKLALASGEEVVLQPDMVRFQAAAPEGVVGAEFAGGAVYLDTQRTPELRAEGLARDVVRRVQEMRKEAGMERSQTIATQVALPPALAEALAPWVERMAAQTRSRQLELTQGAPQGRWVKDWDLDEAKVTIGIAPA